VQVVSFLATRQLADASLMGQDRGPSMVQACTLSCQRILFSFSILSTCFDPYFEDISNNFVTKRRLF
jgi:hypothetical protein